MAAPPLAPNPSHQHCHPQEQVSECTRGERDEDVHQRAPQPTRAHTMCLEPVRVCGQVRSWGTLWHQARKAQDRTLAASGVKQ